VAIRDHEEIHMSDSTDVNDWNTQIIAEFRANAGKLGGMFEGAPVLLLHTIGAKSGTERVHPLMSLPLGRGWAIFASKAGAPTNPDWLYNLRAHPDTTIEVGTEVVAVRAREAEGEEREQIWEQQKAAYPQFAGYEAKTTRTIPVVVLEPTG
jgi:deazaflavin-dependent oxidoreductase (nitroreductase family)